MGALADALSARVETRGARILTIDIERFPMVVVAYDLRTKYIPAGNILEPARMSCFAAKWYDEPEPVFHAEYDFGAERITKPAHEAMVLAAWTLLDAADIIVTFNGVSFDVKHINEEFVQVGLTAPTPFKHVDLYRMALRQFDFASHSLAHLADRLGVVRKMDSGGMDNQLAAMRGEPAAWEHLRTYNLGDIATTEAIYDRMRGWMPGHPHIGEIAANEMRCNQCGSTDLVRAGLYRAQVIDYTAWTCRACGAHVRSGQHSRSASTRGIA